MKKHLINEEISRISEIMGIRPNLISEQWWTKLSNKILGRTLEMELEDAALEVLQLRITKLADLLDDEVQSLFKNLPKGKYINLKSVFAKTIAEEIGMTPQIFKQKTMKELADLCASKGLDPSESANFIKWYSKSNNITPKLGPKPKPNNVNTPKVDASSRSLDDKIDDLSKKWGDSVIQDYVDKLKDLKMNSAQIKEFLNDYDTYGAYTTAQIRDALYEIKNKISKQKWGQLSKLAERLGIKDLNPINAAKGIAVIIVLIWGYYLISGSAKKTGLDKKLDELVPGVDETKPTEEPKNTEGSLDNL
jgi:hypothetical protein